MPGVTSPPAALIDERPWGSFEQLTLNEVTTVKVITVAPGQRLSLQTHVHRGEWWQALDAGLTVQVGEETWEPEIGERIWVSPGQAHRAGNAGSSPVRFLEVAFGTFDEDDIVRLEDDYERDPNGSRTLRPGR
jgi:mannose-6-phosphate isomerase